MSPEIQYHCPKCLEHFTPSNLFFYMYVDIDFCWCDWCWEFTIDDTDEGFFEPLL